MDNEIILNKINEVTKDTLMETLGMTFLEATPDKVVATMPVTPRVHQPDGVLHGGASVALAETVGSFASFLNIDASRQVVRGIEISANHLRGVSEGNVTAIAEPIHKGRTTHLWEIKIVDDEQRLISICKLSTIILSKQ